MSKAILVFALGVVSCFDNALAEASAAAQEGPVKVTYVEPEKFIDVRERMIETEPAKNNHLILWKSYVEKQAAKSLSSGQTLDIQFTDIDLAGDIEPSTRTNMMDVRVIKDIYPPRLKFRYQLKDSDGKEIKAGEENIRDMGFLMGAQTNTTEALRHEKKLFERWLKDTLKTE